MRVTLSGAGGVGKTTLMNDLYKHYMFEKLSIPTMSLMPDGIKTHKDVLKMAVNSPSDGIELQKILIDTRIGILKSVGGDRRYVLDRSPVDSLVYYMVQNSAFDSVDHSVSLHKYTIEESMKYADHIIFIIPEGLKSVDDNGIRCSNPLFFEVLNSVFSNIYYEMSKKCNSVVKYYIKDIVSIESRYVEEFSCTLHKISEVGEFLDRKYRAKIINNLIEGDVNEVI